ncbi:hypothetical protein D3C81_443830 [compost metagenome]
MPRRAQMVCPMSNTTQHTHGTILNTQWSVFRSNLSLSMILGGPDSPRLTSGRPHSGRSLGQSQPGRLENSVHGQIADGSFWGKWKASRQSVPIKDKTAWLHPTSPNFCDLHHILRPKLKSYSVIFLKKTELLYLRPKEKRVLRRSSFLDVIHDLGACFSMQFCFSQTPIVS